MRGAAIARALRCYKDLLLALSDSKLPDEGEKGIMTGVKRCRSYFHIARQRAPGTLTASGVASRLTVLINKVSEGGFESDSAETF